MKNQNIFRVPEHSFVTRTPNSMLPQRYCCSGSCHHRPALPGLNFTQMDSCSCTPLCLVFSWDVCLTFDHGACVSGLSFFTAA